jgi:hypothetical protein
VTHRMVTEMRAEIVPRALTSSSVRVSWAKHQFDDRAGRREDVRALDAVRSRAWARTSREATSAARRSWRMKVNRLVIVVG